MTKKNDTDRAVKLAALVKSSKKACRTSAWASCASMASGFQRPLSFKIEDAINQSQDKRIPVKQDLNGNRA